jgi:hypothetical protein
VDLPLFLGPQTTTTGGAGWDETRERAEAQSGGTTGSVREPGDGGVRVGVERGPAMSEFPFHGLFHESQSGAARAEVIFFISGPFFNYILRNEFDQIFLKINPF